MRRWAFGKGLIALLLVGLLMSFGVMRAGAVEPVDMKVLELGQRKLKVVILSGPDFDPKSVRKRGLVVGFEKQGRDGGFVKARKLSGIKDMNGDGRKDRVAVFKLSDADADALRTGEARQIEVRGIYKDGIFHQAFVGRALVGDSDDPTSDCSGLINQEDALIGQRCIWTSAANDSFKPIDVETLVENLNSGLATTNLVIAPDSAVVIEAYGGRGADGANKSHNTCGTAKGGNGGTAGYARTILQASELASLWIYPGEKGDTSGNKAGGAGTVVSSGNLADLTDDQKGSTDAGDIVSYGILALGGGGGGGGDGNVSDMDEECHHGGDGGQGGIAIADTTDNASEAGMAGEKGNPGGGGACAAAGKGGGEAGSTGIGGPGGQASQNEGSGTGGGPLWNGWTSTDNAVFTATAWTFGAGGFNGDDGGRGGGGCGGGGSGSGSSSGHKGGGGGGGSVAAKATVDAGTIQADLIYGTPGSGSGLVSQVVVTFELKTKS